MGEFRERLDTWRDKHQQHERESELLAAQEAEYLRLVEEIYDEERAGHLDDDIQRLFTSFVQAVGRGDSWRPPPEYDPFTSYGEWWKREADEDLRSNFLFTLWWQKKRLDHPNCPEIEFFSLPIAGRAIIRLLAHFRQGAILLSQLYPKDCYHQIPPPEAVQRFIETGGLWERTDEVFLGRLFSEVPGSYFAANLLIAHYKQMVRQIFDEEHMPWETELSDETYTPELHPVVWRDLATLLGQEIILPPEKAAEEDWRLEKGLFAYVTGTPAQDAAKMAGLRKAKFLELVGQLGLTRQRGKNVSS